MTIAACYPCLEGVVFGADSTTTIFVPGPAQQTGVRHHYTFCQKVFEFGTKGSSVGIVTWGLGMLPNVSHRTIIAEAADRATATSAQTLGDVANIFSELFWAEYNHAFAQLLLRVQTLHTKEGRTVDEVRELDYCMESLSVGFCIGGCWGAGRRSETYEIIFSPLLESQPIPRRLDSGSPMYWGCQSPIERVIFGMDQLLFSKILASQKWIGSPEELFTLVKDGALTPPRELPIREAIDLIYAEIYTVIKTMKFSYLAPVCGGPIEIAVVTTDRPFRWVRHKKLSKAITEGYFERAEDEW